MTEVPDYLLQRSRQRRAALGLGDDAGGEVAPSGDAGGATPATTSAASAAPAAPSGPAPIPAGTPEPEPAPTPPNVEAALRRKRIPIWAMPVLILLPLWVYAYVGTLEPPTEEAAGAIDVGAEVYAACAACHGAGGGGGVGPAFDGVTETFTDPAQHAQWVYLGSTGWQAEVGDSYGDTNTPVAGGMPGFPDLTPEELTAVILYERVEFGGADPVAEGLVDEEGNLLVVYNPETATLEEMAG